MLGKHDLASDSILWMSLGVTPCIRPPAQPYPCAKPLLRDHRQAKTWDQFLSTQGSRRADNNICHRRGQMRVRQEVSPLPRRLEFTESYSSSWGIGAFHRAGSWLRPITPVTHGAGSGHLENVRTLLLMGSRGSECSAPSWSGLARDLGGVHLHRSCCTVYCTLERLL